MGENSHPHLDCFLTFEHRKRQDVVRKTLFKQIKKDYTDENEKYNFKIIRNICDSSDAYGIGYSAKERGEHFTNIPASIIDRSIQYYLDNKERVEELKHKHQELGVKHYNVNDIAFQFVEYIEFQYVDRKATYYSIHQEFFSLYRGFLKTLGKRLSYASYSKLKSQTMYEYVCLQLCLEEPSNVETTQYLNHHRSLIPDLR